MPTVDVHHRFKLGKNEETCETCGRDPRNIIHEVAGGAVVHPSHYGGDTTYEAIKVIEAWNLGFCLGNTVKYISRAGRKDPKKLVEDLEKARWYLDREIEKLKRGS